MRPHWIALAAFAGVASGDGTSAAVERGRYVATAANCVSCHTRTGGPEYAGGRPLATPLGRIYSTNITPDREAGIGSWSAGDLKRALREGIAADGRHLFPAFPYTFYTRMTDADIADLYAYLRTIKPARDVAPENDRAFRFRLPMAAWKALNLEPGAFRPDAGKSPEWNRGAYLVQGPGHCGACHTARTWTLAEQSSAPLRGAVMRDEVKDGELRDWFAVDLGATKQGLGAWSTDHIVQYLGKGYSARAGSFGPMNAVIANSTRHLTAGDLRAVAVYLQSLGGTDYAGPVVPAEDARAGRPLYEAQCAECHGGSGRGGLFDGPPLAGSAVVQGQDASSLINIVLHGSDRPEEIASPAWETMPAFAGKLDDTEIADLANYLRASWGNRAPPVGAEAVARQRHGD
jgi:alcohol dehydrogenase (quinone), cytochrome c subunit